MKGGPIMWPLLVCAVLAVAVMIERYLVLRRFADEPDASLRLLQAGREMEALREAERQDSPSSALVAEAIRNRHLPLDAIERKLEAKAQRETPRLTHRLGTLDTIITVAPLLGLLGTVTGMIRAFHVVGDPSSLNGPSAITGGVAEALIATATGLTIAIVTVIGYNALGERVKEATSAMESAANAALEALAAPTFAKAREIPTYEAQAARA
jgi:biopolymer transport protein ExbB